MTRERILKSQRCLPSIWEKGMRPECLVLVILDVNANGLSPRYSFKGELPLTSVLLPFRKDPKCIL